MSIDDKKDHDTAIFLARKLNNIFSKTLDGKKNRSAFIIGSHSLSILIATFVESLFHDLIQQDKKNEFIDEIALGAKSLIYLNFNPKNNMEEKH